MNKIILAVAIAAVATMSVAAFASAGVQRTQQATGLVVTAQYQGQTYVHTYTLNDAAPCNSADVITGSGTVAGFPSISEAITMTLDGAGNISINSTYTGSSPLYTWSYTGPLNGGGTYHDTLNQAVTLSFALTTTSYANHGAYVKAQGGGSDAAHSCIGMPIN